LRIPGFKKFFKYCKENEECVSYYFTVPFHWLKICIMEICTMGEREKERER